MGNLPPCVGQKFRTSLTRIRKIHIGRQSLLSCFNNLARYCTSERGFAELPSLDGVYKHAGRRA